MSTIGARTSPRSVCTSSSTRRSDAPAASARCPARWMTGPSPTGSENGTPSSMTSAPRRSASINRRAVASSEGSPAVKKATSARSPRARSVSNVPASRLNRPSGGPRHGPPPPPTLGRAPAQPWRASTLTPDLSLPQRLAHDLHVLVAPSGQADDDDLGPRELLGQAERVRDGVGRLQRRHDAFQPRQLLEAFQRLLVGDRDELE